MITLLSHGFKFGHPAANVKIDVSFLPNPWRYPERDPEEVLQESEAFHDLVESIFQLAKTYHKHFPDENIVVGICCSAGEYRSPVTAEAVSTKLSAIGIKHTLQHNHARNQKCLT